MKAYVVTEGELDAELLKRVLPEEHLREVHVVAAGGSSSAVSLARSILARRRTPVALVVDGDTIDDDAAEERRELLQDLLASAAGDVPSAIFMALPSIEAIFFEDRAMLQELTGASVPDEAWWTGRFTPKKVLDELLCSSGRAPGLLSVLDALNDDRISKLRDTQLIRSIDVFLGEITAEARAQGVSN